MPDIRTAAIALYDRFTHEGMDRRDFMAELTRLAGSAAAANALLLAIAADPAAAAITNPYDERLITRNGVIGVENRAVSGYVATPREDGKYGAVLVIHENRGLNRHVEDVARRVALAGYIAVAPDFLSPFGGTPDDEDKAREMIGKLDLGQTTTVALGVLDRMHGLDHSNGKVGAVGFCWGGAFVNRLAVAAGGKLNAGVSYYGPAPAPEEAAKVAAPLLIQLAGEDARVNATGEPWAAALKKAGKQVETYTYPGVQHAFNNDTSVERYNKAAADLAWKRTLAFFGRYLKS